MLSFYLDFLAGYLKTHFAFKHHDDLANSIGAGTARRMLNRVRFIYLV